MPKKRDPWTYTLDDISRMTYDELIDAFDPNVLFKESFLSPDEAEIFSVKFGCVYFFLKAERVNREIEEQQ